MNRSRRRISEGPPGKSEAAKVGSRNTETVFFLSVADVGRRRQRHLFIGGKRSLYSLPTSSSHFPCLHLTGSHFLWKKPLPFDRRANQSAGMSHTLPNSAGFFLWTRPTIPFRPYGCSKKKEKNAENSSWMNTGDPKQKRQIVNVRKNKRMRPPAGTNGTSSEGG